MGDDRLLLTMFRYDTDKYLCLVKTRGSEEIVLNYFDAVLNDKRARKKLQKMIDEKKEKNEFYVGPNTANEMLTRRKDVFVSSMRSVGYADFSDTDYGKWIMHRSHEEGIYDFILVGDDCKHNLPEYVRGERDHLEDFLKNVGFEVFEERDASIV